MTYIKYAFIILFFLALAGAAFFASGNIYNAILINPALSTLLFFASPVLISGLFFALAIKKENAITTYIGFVLIAAATLISFVMVYKTAITPFENGIYNAEANFHLNKNNLPAHDQMRFNGIHQNNDPASKMTYAQIMVHAINTVGKDALIFEGKYKYTGEFKLGKYTFPMKLFKFFNPNAQSQTLYPKDFYKKLYERQLCYLEKWDQASSDQKTDTQTNKDIEKTRKFLKKHQQFTGKLQIIRGANQSCLFTNPMGE